MSASKLHNDLRAAAGLAPLDEEVQVRVEIATGELAEEVRAEERFRLYALRDGERRTLADTSMEGIGITLVTLHAEGEYDQHDRIGIRDRQARVWIVNPWARGAS